MSNTTEVAERLQTYFVSQTETILNHIKEQPMRTLTLTQQTGLQLEAHLDIDQLVPVATTTVAQGDVLARPVPTKSSAQLVPIPAKGVPIVEGVHDHVLCGQGTYMTITSDRHIVAIIECEEPVYLLHQEHGGQGLNAGTWEIRRQTEVTAAGVRQVAD